MAETQSTASGHSTFFGRHRTLGSWLLVLPGTLWMVLSFDEQLLPVGPGVLLTVSPLPPRYAPYWPEFQRRYSERIDPEALEALDHWRASGRRESDPLGYARAYTQVSLATFCLDPSRAATARSAPFGTERWSVAYWRSSRLRTA